MVDWNSMFCATACQLMNRTNRSNTHRDRDRDRDRDRYRDRERQQETYTHTSLVDLVSAAA
jgi:Ni/Co efflux regulator RcnB